MFGKKTYGMTWVAAVLLLASAGCVQIEQVGGFSDIPMSFRTYTARSVQGETKADDSFVPSNTNTLPDDSSFGVFAFYQEGEIGSGTPAQWSSARKPNFMFNLPVLFNGTTYSYGSTRYWPANEENTISFWAYYPYNAGSLGFYADDSCTADYESGSAGLPRVKYTVALNAASQQDLMFDSFENTNKTYENCSPTKGTVPLVFRHVLSLVEFAVLPSGELPAGTTVYVNSLKLIGINRTGICTNPAASLANDAAAAFWSNQTDATTLEAPIKIENADLSSSASLFLMMPQTLAATAKVSLNFDLRFKASDGSEDISYSGNTGEVLIKTNDIPQWLPGRHYVYNLTVDFEKIAFDAIVEKSWITTTVQTVSE